jgi:hypothetical protein
MSVSLVVELVFIPKLADMSSTVLGEEAATVTADNDEKEEEEEEEEGGGLPRADEEAENFRLLRNLFGVLMLLLLLRRVKTVAVVVVVVSRGAVTCSAEKSSADKEAHTVSRLDPDPDPEWDCVSAAEEEEMTMQGEGEGEGEGRVLVLVLVLALRRLARNLLVLLVRVRERGGVPLSLLQPRSRLSLLPALALTLVLALTRGLVLVVTSEYAPPALMPGLLMLLLEATKGAEGAVGAGSPPASRVRSTITRKKSKVSDINPPVAMPVLVLVLVLPSPATSISWCLVRAPPESAEEDVGGGSKCVGKNSDMAKEKPQNNRVLSLSNFRVVNIR